jgi:hypothetical protein
MAAPDDTLNRFETDLEVRRFDRHILESETHRRGAG